MCGNIRDQAGKDGVPEDSFQAVMQAAVVSHALGHFIRMFSTMIIVHLFFFNAFHDFMVSGKRILA